MLTELQITTAAIDRLKAILPAKFTPAIIPLPEKPEEVTDEVIKDKYPLGLFVIENGKSEGISGMEMKRLVVNIVGLDVDKVADLATAVKMALNGFQITGSTRFEFEVDEPNPPEAGVISRAVTFTTRIPACQVAADRLTAAITALNL